MKDNVIIYDIETMQELFLIVCMVLLLYPHLDME
jgi:hypothetical protein